MPTNPHDDGLQEVVIAGIRLSLDADGSPIVPPLCGAEEPPDEDPDTDPAPDPAVDPEPDEDDPDPDPDEGEPFDKDRAMRTIERQREAEKKAREEARRAKARIKELEDAQLSEQEKVVRDRDEAKAEAQRHKDRADRLTIDNALKDAAIEAGVDPKRLRRALRLIDRDGVAIDGDDVTGAQEAIDDFLGEFPEFKATEPEPGEPKREPAGGQPDRKRKPKEMTPEQVQELARSNPEEFNRLWDEGRIPQSALG